MLIAATSDIHGPNYFRDFITALDGMKAKPDVFLLAGDIIERGMSYWWDKIHAVLVEKVKCHIMACFGNNEFIPDQRVKISRMFGDVKFLDDDAHILEVRKRTIGIVGTIGSLDEPTRWQKEHISGIEKVYEERVSTVEKFLGRMTTDVRIVLMHYAPTYKTLEGEYQSSFPGMGSSRYESMLEKTRPTLVIHGHSHGGTKFAMVGSVPVFNVALPLNKEIVVIDTDKLRSGVTQASF